MNKSLTKPLIRPLGGRWARVCLTALLTAVVTVGAQARATCESGTRACADSLGGAQDRTAVEGGTPSRTAGDIFLPAAGNREDSVLKDAGSLGYYWSSSLDTLYSKCGRYLSFASGGHDSLRYLRYYGFSVRPVRP